MIWAPIDFAKDCTLSLYVNKAKLLLLKLLHLGICQRRFSNEKVGNRKNLTPPLLYQLLKLI